MFVYITSYNFPVIARAVVFRPTQSPHTQRETASGKSGPRRDVPARGNV